MSWTFRVSLTNVRVSPLVGAGEQPEKQTRSADATSTAGENASHGHDAFWERFVDASVLRRASAVDQPGAWQPCLHVYFDGMEKELPLRLVQGSAAAAPLRDSSTTLSPSSTHRSVNSPDLDASSLVAVPAKDLFFSYSIEACSAADLTTSLARRTAALHVLLQRTPAAPAAASPLSSWSSPQRQLQQSGLAPDGEDGEAGEVLVLASATIPLLDLAVAADDRFFFDVYATPAAAASRAGSPRGFVSVSLRMEEEGEVTLQPRLLCVRGLHLTSTEYQVRYGWQRNPALALGTREKRAQASRSRESSPSRPSPHPSPVKLSPGPADDDPVERHGLARAPSEEGCVTFKMAQLPPLQLTCSRAALEVQQLFFEVLTQPAEANGETQPNARDSGDVAGSAVVTATGQLALRQFLVAAHRDAEVGAAFTVSCSACAAAGVASRPCLIEGILELRGIAHVRYELERHAASSRKRETAARGVEAPSPVPLRGPAAGHPAEVSSVLSSFVGDPLITPPQSLRSYQEHIALVYPPQSASMPTSLSAPLLPNALARGQLAAADRPAKTAAAARQRRLSPLDTPLAQTPAPDHPTRQNERAQNSAAGNGDAADGALQQQGPSEDGIAAMDDPSTASRVSQWAETPNDEVRSRLGIYSPHLQEFAAVDSGPIAAASSASAALAAELAEEPSTSRAPPRTPPQPSALQLNPEVSQGCSLSPTGSPPVRANEAAAAALASGSDFSSPVNGEANAATEVPGVTRSGNPTSGLPDASVVASASSSGGGANSRPAPLQPPQLPQIVQGPSRLHDVERGGRDLGDSSSSSQRPGRSDSHHTSVPFSPPVARHTATAGDAGLHEHLSANATLKPPPSAPTTQLDSTALSGASQPQSTRGRAGGGGDRHRRRSSSVDPALVLHFSDTAAGPDAAEVGRRTASHMSFMSTNTAESSAAPPPQRRRQPEVDAPGPTSERSLSRRSAGSPTPGTDLVGHPSVAVILGLLAPPPPPPAPPLFDATHSPPIPHKEAQQARVVAARLSAQYRTLLRVYADRLARLASAEKRAAAAAAAAATAQSPGDAEGTQRVGHHGNAAGLERCAQETAQKQRVAQEWQELAGALQQRLRGRQVGQQQLDARLHAKAEALASAEEELQFMLAQLVQQRQTLDEKGVAPQTADVEAVDEGNERAAARRAQAALTEQLSEFAAWESRQSTVPATSSQAARPPLQQPPIAGFDDVEHPREAQARETATSQRGGRVVAITANSASSAYTDSHTSAPGSQPEHRRLFATPMSPSSPPTGRPASSPAGAAQGPLQASAARTGSAPPGTSKTAPAPPLAIPHLDEASSARKGEAVASPPRGTPPVYARPHPVPPSGSVSQGSFLEPASRRSTDALAPPHSPFTRSHAALTLAKERGLQSPTTSPPITSLSRIEHDTLRDGIDKGDRALVLHLLHTKPQLFFADNNLLHFACAATLPDTAIVEALLKARPELAGGVDASTGNTALHVACAARYPSAPIVKRLILAGTPVDTRNRRGLTPFHVCVLNSADAPIHRVKDTLLSVGSSSVNERTADGRTPLHLVCHADELLPLVRYLVLRGADLWARARCVDPATQTAADVTPMQLSRLHGAVAVSRYLQQAALEDRYAYQ